MRRSLAMFGVYLLVAGCRDNPVANPIDAPVTEALGGRLTRASLQQLATGVNAQDRTVFNGSGYLIVPAILARDLYFVAVDSRWIDETLGEHPDPSTFIGSTGFGGFYVTIRAASTVLRSLRDVDPSQIGVAEVNATRGYLRTITALSYYRLIELRDTVGIPVQADDPAEIMPIRCKTAVLDFIAALLDSASADLAAAGTATWLPFTLPTGYSTFGRNYNTVGNLILLNRGLKGKIDLYRALDRTGPQQPLLQASIAELTQALNGAAPGTVPASQLPIGAYYRFSGDGSDDANVRSAGEIGLNPMAADSLQPGDARRFKVVSRSLLANWGVSTSKTFYGSVPSPASQALPISLLRDEELILLRAQAEMEAGSLADATADINSVRTAYGLPPHAVFASRDAAVDAVLYEKRYSFLFEGAHRLVDLRAYKRLNEAYLRKELPTDPFNKALPIPRNEVFARGLTEAPACIP